MHGLLAALKNFKMDKYNDLIDQLSAYLSSVEKIKTEFRLRNLFSKPVE